MPKIRLEYTRTRVDTATVELDVSDEVADTLRREPNTLRAWATFTVAPTIKPDAWKPAGVQTAGPPDGVTLTDSRIDGEKVRPIFRWEGVLSRKMDACQVCDVELAGKRYRLMVQRIGRSTFGALVNGGYIANSWTMDEAKQYLEGWAINKQKGA